MLYIYMHSAVPGDVIVELMQHLKVTKNFPPVQVWLAIMQVSPETVFSRGRRKNERVGSVVIGQAIKTTETQCHVSTKRIQL